MNTFTKSRPEYTLPLVFDEMRALSDFHLPFPDELFINGTRRVAESSVKLVPLFDLYNEAFTNVVR